MDRLQKLQADAAATFVLSASGRILRENDPDHSPGPRVFFAGCSEGNLAYVRHDVPEDVAAVAAALMNAEPPWVKAGVLPARLPGVLDLLAPAAVGGLEVSLIYVLPRQAGADATADLVRSGTPEGEALLATLRRSGMPAHLVDAGFLGVGDLWSPWCVALEGGTSASIAFAARLGERGAAVGVYTFADFRGRGLAAAVTAGWSALPELNGLELFYSTLSTNTSSRQVAARLGLRQIGLGLRIA